jgi:perosamine synthetase
MVDNNIPWWRVNFSEDDVQKVAESIRNEHVSMGAVTAEFEMRLAEALGVPYVVAATNGSVAILMALMALDIKEGDEVIVPNRTWVATAHAPLMLGAKVVIVDVLPDRPLMDVAKVRDKITAKTKAIIPVPLNGRAVEMQAVWDLAGEFGLHVVEDAAQSLFARYNGKYMGTESAAGCFSLSIAKLIPTGQGGFVVTKDKGVYESLRAIRTHGVEDVNSGTPYLRFGYNFRITDLQSSLGLVQLDQVPKRIKKLQELYLQYEEGLAGMADIHFMPVDLDSGEIPLYAEILCPRREELAAYLDERGVQTRPFYPNLETAAHLGVSDDFPNSRVFAEQGLVLPCGPDQPYENVARVIEVLKGFERGTS